MPRTGVKATVQPVDAIQPLDDAHTAPAQAPESGEIPDAAGEQNRLTVRAIQIKADLVPAFFQPGSQFTLEGGHPANIACPGKDADTSHAEIIP